MNRPHPDSLRQFSDPAYRPPDPEDVRAVVADILDYTGDQVAALVGASNGRVVRRWLASPTAKNRAQIDYAAWRLLLLEAGLVRPPKRRFRSYKMLEEGQTS